MLAIHKPALPCNFRIEGRIENGLLQQIKATLSSAYIGRDLVCLDSPGGSLVEALKIAEFFKNKPVATKIEAGARCESACALMFMAGSFSYFEGAKSSWRVLHPKAYLGFHAPELRITDGNYNEKAVLKSYNTALAIVSKTIFELSLGARDFDDDGERAIELSLLGYMLNTPHANMYYIDTVDKAGRWRISLYPIKKITPKTDLHFKYACFNQLSWQSDLFAAQKLKQYAQYSDSTFRGDKDVSVSVNELLGIGCTFPFKEGSAEPKDYVVISGQNKALTPMHFYHPATRLEMLAD